MAVKDQVQTDRYALYLGDACEVLPTLRDATVHISVYSPPFAASTGGLYHYSSSPRDLSNCRSYAEFFDHYDFIVREMERLIVPGGLTGVHCMDVPSGNTGRDARRDFPGDIIRLHARCRDRTCTAPALERDQGLCGHGWFDWTARYCIWKEPLTVRNRTMAKNLAHKTIVDDSSRCSNAAADYLLMFRKKGVRPEPIAHPTGLETYAGEREIPAELLSYRGWTGKQTENRYSHWIWRQYASAFWDDIRLDEVLEYKAARDAEDEKHIHPLQLDVIDRCLVLWSNPGDVVLTPCMGVGSEVFAAVRAGRKAIGVELKESYYRQAVRNLAECAAGAALEQREMFA